MKIRGLFEDTMTHALGGATIDVPGKNICPNVEGSPSDLDLDAIETSVQARAIEQFVKRGSLVGADEVRALIAEIRRLRGEIADREDHQVHTTGREISMGHPHSWLFGGALYNNPDHARDCEQCQFMRASFAGQAHELHVVLIEFFDPVKRFVLRVLNGLVWIMQTLHLTKQTP